MTATSTVTLRADRPALADPAVRETVVAAATALAERTGVRLVSVDADEASLEAVIEGDRIAAIGFASELRRSTNRWARARLGQALWPAPPAG